MNIELIDQIHKQLEEEAGEEGHNYLLVAQVDNEQATIRAETMPWFLKTSIVQLARCLSMEDKVRVAIEILSEAEKEETDE